MKELKILSWNDANANALVYTLDYLIPQDGLSINKAVYV